MTDRAALTVFDTSALVAAPIQQHPDHAWADTQFKIAKRPALWSHSLAELYSVLTGSPQLRVAPPQALETLEHLTETMEVLPLGAAQYLRAVSRCQALHLQGGAIYDPLLAVAALEAGAAGLVTLNPKHFRRLGEDVERLVISPE
ncbi:Ribonuclease VapC [Deinococcus saxicola]|uniref:PIN domain-containing protein n=1 Tax=Deinococcus saxicola TaxID=249406 RepID=UPI0039EF9712